MSKWVVDIHGDIEGDYDIVKKYEELEIDVLLDNIKNEIQAVYNDRPYTYNHSQRTELFCEVLEIIDKYKAESEE